MLPVEEYILTKPSPRREMLDYCYQLCLSHGLKPKLSYGIPFYFGKRRICYTNYHPQQGLEFCFIYGQKMIENKHLLKAKKRNEIMGITYKNLASIDEAILKVLLKEAIKLDAMHP